MPEITILQLNQALMRTIYKTYYRWIVEATPKKDGHVADGWDVESTPDGVMIVNEEYGVIIHSLEDGAKPHMIEAKNGGFLKFKKPNKKSSNKKPIPGNIAFEKDGYIFTKKVRHPGIKARKFITKVLDSQSNKDEFQKVLESEFERLLESTL